MRNNNYRHPLAGIVLMALVCVVITVIFITAGDIAPFGRAIGLVFGAAIVVAVVVTLVRMALHRAGVHRLAEVRTWPQN